MSDRADDFRGYRRADGRVGVRNHLLVLSTGGLTGGAARRIGAALAGAIVIILPHGGGLLGRDLMIQRRAIAGLATHPNVGAAILVGDNPRVMAQAQADIAPSLRPHACFTLDDCGHDGLALTDHAIRAGGRLLREISRQARTEQPAAALGIGLECGRSDPSSGLVANPLLGLTADWLVGAGGWAVLGETLEWLGAETLLAERARSAAIAASITDAVLARERIAVADGLDLLGSNPGPTNIAAGLSTIEEKSLGNIAKSGSQPIEGILDYGEAPTRPGLWTMDASAYAPKSLTGFVVSGASMLLFTTGVGNPYVSALAPTIKLSANPETCAALADQLDFDASGLFTGRETLEEAAAALRRRVLEIASGELTWGEIMREGDEVLSRFGPAL